MAYRLLVFECRRICNFGFCCILPGSGQNIRQISGPLRKSVYSAFRYLISSCSDLFYWYLIGANVLVVVGGSMMPGIEVDE